MFKRPSVFTVIIFIALAVMNIVLLIFIYQQRKDQTENIQVPGGQISIAEAQQRIAEFEQRIAELEYMLDNTDDPDVVRRIAEELLGLVSPDQIIISSGAHSGDYAD
ncbi:MAG: hypothetical protein FWH17_02055 [Oscillospiraceae bacterium]|nr:hypothetical protein [Oscillospiraceae bacterium]